MNGQDLSSQAPSFHIGSMLNLSCEVTGGMYTVQGRVAQVKLDLFSFWVNRSRWGWGPHFVTESPLGPLEKQLN